MQDSQALSPESRRTGCQASAVPADIPTVVLRGRRALQERAGEVEACLRGSDDTHSVPPLRVWMRDAAAQSGVPLAALVHEGDVLVAVLLAVEVTVAGIRTRLAYSGNVTGHGGFFTAAEATPEKRSERLIRAGDALLDRAGILGLLLSVKVQDGLGGLAPSSLRVSAHAQRQVYDTFDLQLDFDSSLASLGAHTRRNLRYYRRRAESELQTVFHPQLHGATLRDAVLDLRSAMPDDLPPGVLKNRIAHIAGRPEAFCMGVRAADGRWLSWVSGWRSGRHTYVDWQCNRAGLARYSLSTVMRSYLIEQESRRAQSQIRFLGGTPHTMHYGFREEVCRDWLLTADSLSGRGVALALRMAAWLRRASRPQREGAPRAHTRAPRRHRVSQLLVRMVGTILRAEAQA